MTNFKSKQIYPLQNLENQAEIDETTASADEVNCKSGWGGMLGGSLGQVCIASANKL